MRFSMNLISCFGPVVPVVAAPTSWTAGEVCTLEKCYGGSGKVGSRKAILSAQWRPTLSTISEDDAVNIDKPDNAIRPVNKQKKLVQSIGNSQTCRHMKSYLSEEASLRTGIPTFFPAPFLF